MAVEIGYTYSDVGSRSSGKDRYGAVSTKTRTLFERAADFANQSLSGSNRIGKVDIYSGGQPKGISAGKGKKRTPLSGLSDYGGGLGSTRHDLGGAGDVHLYDVNGNRLDYSTAAGKAAFNEFAKAAASYGATGIGFGNGYMGLDTIHVGFGNQATWGGMPKDMQRAIATGRLNLQPDSLTWNAQDEALGQISRLGFVDALGNPDIAAFQKANGLPVDGKIGPITETIAYFANVDATGQPAISLATLTSPGTTEDLPGYGTSAQKRGPTPPAAVTGLGSMTLKRGMENQNVAELQKTLTTLGYDVGTIDGVYGSRTKSAVEAYQKATGLPVTGKVDAKTHSFIDPTYEELNPSKMPNYGPNDMGTGMINRPITIDEVRPRLNPTLAAASTTDAASIAPDFAETDFNVGAMGRPSPSAPTAPSNKQKQAASQVNRAAMERRGEPAITPEQVTASSRQNVLGNNPELRASTTPAATLAARPSPAALDAYRAPTTSELDSADTLTRKDMDATAQTRAGVAAGPLSVSDRVKAIAKEVAARTDLTKAEKLDYARAALDQSMGFPADPSLKVKSSIVSEIAAAATGPAKSASAAPIPRPSPIAPGTPASAASASLAIPDRVTAAQSGFRPTVNQSPPMPRPNPVEDLNPKTPPKSYPNGPVPVANPLRDNFDPSQQQPVSAAPGAARNASINTLMSDAFGNLPTPARDDALYDSLDGRYSPGNSPWGPISPEDDPRVTQSATPDAASLPRLTNRLEKQNLSAPPDARPTIGDPVMGDTRYGYGAGAPGQAGIGISTQKDLLDLMGAQMGPVSSDVGMYYDAPQSASRPSPAQQSEVVTGKNYGYGLDPQYDLGKAALAAAGSGLPGLVGYGIGATIGGGTGTKFDMAIADAKEARNPSGVPATSQVYEQAYEMSPSQGSYPINSPLSAPAPSTYAAAVPGMLDVQPAFGADKPLDAMTPTELSAYMAANPYGFGSPIAPPVPQAQLVAPPPPQVAGVASTRVAGAARPSPYGQWSSDIARMSSGMQPGSVSVSRNRPSVGFSNMVSGRDGYGHSVSSYTGQNGVQHNTTQIGRGSFYSRDSSGSRSDSGGRSGGSNGGRASSGGGSANGRSGSSSNARNR